MSKEDYLNHFLPFFRDDCAGGTEVFDFPNPFDNGATQIEVRFLIDTRGNPFQVKQFSPESVRVSFVLEELPS
ncbi:hypothetical protein [Marispirochaeta aestuarii]|uniref:hypothetical protein n=1 Tax=Marispirochaeta aestuarii TaxID=1963862 RepID=UPI002ABE4100|nr:hypothetical protein [Marispirochaeta aestuarii]